MKSPMNMLSWVGRASIVSLMALHNSLIDTAGDLWTPTIVTGGIIMNLKIVIFMPFLFVHCGYPG